jgi:hypothetical protein
MKVSIIAALLLFIPAVASAEAPTIESPRREGSLAGTTAEGQKHYSDRPQADSDWDLIQIQVAPVGPLGRLTTSIQPRFAELADQARSFRIKYPNHPKADEAMVIELRSLYSAILAHADVDLGRASDLAADIRRKSTLPATVRLEMASMAEIVRNKDINGDQLELLAAQEKSARRIINEFPDEDAAYDLLYRVAANHPDRVKRMELADEIAERRPASSLGREARAMRDRDALVGRSLQTLTGASLGKNVILSGVKTGGMVIYTWSSNSPGAWRDIKKLVLALPATVSIVGINIDSDEAAAKSIAAREGLPGNLYYDHDGENSPLAAALKIDGTPRLYLVAATGEIREISSKIAGAQTRVQALSK